MKARLLTRIFLVTVGLICAATGSYAQQRPQAYEDPPLPSGIIEGRVRLPSGHSISTNVKVILSNKQSPLYTLYTNKNGEFRFTELIEGIYVVEVFPGDKAYEPSKQEVRLIRGGQLGLTIYLSTRRHEIRSVASASTVSAEELSQNVPAAAKKQYQQAWKLIANGRILAAIDRLKDAVSIYPEYLSARNDLGAQYLKLGRLNEAAEQLNAVIDKSPNYWDSRLNLGLVLVEQGKYSEAIDQLRKAVLLDGSRPAAHLWLGVALGEQEELDEAAHELLRARLAGGARYAVARYYLARIHIKRREPDQALTELNAYLEEAPKGEKSAEAKQLIERLRH